MATRELWLYFLYLRVLSVNTFLAGGCWLCNNHHRHHFCLWKNPLLVISFFVGGNSILTGDNRARAAVHVSLWLSYIPQLQRTDCMTTSGKRILLWDHQRLLFRVPRFPQCNFEFTGSGASQELLRQSDYIFSEPILKFKFRLKIKKYIYFEFYT